jgi:hypothetical protein
MRRTVIKCTVATLKQQATILLLTENNFVSFISLGEHYTVKYFAQKL